MTVDPTLGFELEMCLYAETVEDALEAETLRQLVTGGCWGDDAAFFAELIHTASTLRRYPPTELAKRLLE